MGTVLSYVGGYFQSNEPDPITGLTPRQKYLVQNTWMTMRKDMVEGGIKLFMSYFKMFPQYHNYFPFNDVALDELPQNKRFHAHAANVMYSLSSFIDSLDNNEVLIHLLEKSGESHGRRNVPEQAYWDLKKSTIEMLRNELGSRFNKEVEEAWDKSLSVAFTVLAKSLLENHPKT